MIDSILDARSFLYDVSERVISPNRWKGECDCLVGPFSSKQVAEYFTSAKVDFGHYETFETQIVAKRDSWYVQARKRN
jgi:hypothetical protein